jgi:hypothetical protein
MVPATFEEFKRRIASRAQQLRETGLIGSAHGVRAWRKPKKVEKEPEEEIKLSKLLDEYFRDES